MLQFQIHSFFPFFHYTGHERSNSLDPTRRSVRILRRYEVVVTQEHWMRLQSYWNGKVHTCQTITPAFHPEFFACWTQVASVEGSMNPLASPAVAGFSITILLRLTPAAWISKTEDWVKGPPELVTRPVQVVYSLPSKKCVSGRGQWWSMVTHDYRTIGKNRGGFNHLMWEQTKELLPGHCTNDEKS